MQIQQRIEEAKRLRRLGLQQKTQIMVLPGKTPLSSCSGRKCIYIALQAHKLFEHPELSRQTLCAPQRHTHAWS